MKFTEEAGVKVKYVRLPKVLPKLPKAPPKLVTKSSFS